MNKHFEEAVVDWVKLTNRLRKVIKDIESKGIEE